MFGFACKETHTLMPLPIYLAHRLVENHANQRRSGELGFVRPDAKSQVTVEYNADGTPLAFTPSSFRRSTTKASW